MSVDYAAAYVDTSCLLAIAFDEPSALHVSKILESCPMLISSNLLEAEFRAALHREGIEDGAALLARCSWIHPRQSLAAEFCRVLTEGYVRGADLWHLACALHVSPKPQELAFLTLDDKQIKVARRLGFPGLEELALLTHGSDNKT